MLWPLILPLQITAALLAAAISAATALAPRLKRKRGPVFMLTTLAGLVAFVPSLYVVQWIVDSQRFGTFHYDGYAEVQDFRVERYLPPAATDITLYKRYGGNGYVARYHISADDLQSYVDGLWDEFGDLSAIPRDELDADGQPVAGGSVDRPFNELGWATLRDAIQFYSPVEDDGGGAAYFFDRQSGIVYQDAGYW